MAKRVVPDGMFTTADLCRAADITARQVQWWSEHGVFGPVAMHRHHRLFTIHQLNAAKRIAKLRKADVSLRDIVKRRLHTWKFNSVVRIKSPEVIGNVLIVPYC